MTNKEIKNIIEFIYVLFFLLLLGGSVAASDLDDGIAIDKPIDDSIKADQNINYIIVKAKSKVKTSRGANGRVKTNKAGEGNINIGAGANLRGATIINLSENKGNNVAK